MWGGVRGRVCVGRGERKGVWGGVRVQGVWGGVRGRGCGEG